MTAPRPPQPPAEPERRLVPGTPPLLIAFVVVLVLGFCIALVAAVFHRGPQTCVRLYADSGRVVRQWTTDHGANTPLTLQMYASKLLFSLDDDTDVVAAHAEAFAAQVLAASRNVYGGTDRQTHGRARDVTEAARKKREEQAALADLKARAKAGVRALPAMPMLLEVPA